jgi:hypothetical protein
VRHVRLRLTSPSSPVPLAAVGLVATALDLAAAALALGLAVDAWAPAEDLPWKPLSLQAPLGLATSVKFARAAPDPARCRAVLREGGVSFLEEPARAERACSTANALRITGGVVPLSPAAPVVTCPEALAYAFWMRHQVQPTAQAVLGAAVARVEHYGSYACRNIYGRSGGRLSEHARANALDVAGFRLADGRRVTVARHYREAGPRGQFLRAAQVAGCRWFRAVLGPDYNAAHRDHLHLDFGRYRICR